MIALQILVLYLTKNYILFLIIKIIFRLLENVILSIIVNKLYEYLKEPSDDLSKEDKQSILYKRKNAESNGSAFFRFQKEIYIIFHQLNLKLSNERDLLRDDVRVLCDHLQLPFFHGNHVCLLSFC